MVEVHTPDRLAEGGAQRALEHLTVFEAELRRASRAVRRPGAGHRDHVLVEVLAGTEPSPNLPLTAGRLVSGTAPRAPQWAGPARRSAAWAVFGSVLLLVSCGFALHPDASGISVPPTRMTAARSSDLEEKQYGQGDGPRPQSPREERSSTTCSRGLDGGDCPARTADRGLRSSLSLRVARHTGVRRSAARRQAVTYGPGLPAAVAGERCPAQGAVRFSGTGRNRSRSADLRARHERTEKRREGCRRARGGRHTSGRCARADRQGSVRRESRTAR